MSSCTDDVRVSGAVGNTSCNDAEVSGKARKQRRKLYRVFVTLKKIQQLADLRCSLANGFG